MDQETKDILDKLWAKAKEDSQPKEDKSFADTIVTKEMGLPIETK